MLGALAKHSRNLFIGWRHDSTVQIVHYVVSNKYFMHPKCNLVLIKTPFGWWRAPRQF